MKLTLAWKEVVRYHGTIPGIGVKNGLVKSILCIDGKKSVYPNRIFDNVIT